MIVSFCNAKKGGVLLTQKNSETKSYVVKQGLVEFQKGIYFIKGDSDGIIE